MMDLIQGDASARSATPHHYVAVYMREQMLTTSAEANRLRLGLIRFAESRGLTVSGIFIERLETPSSAFASMYEKLASATERYVIIPGVHHFAGLGNSPLSILESLKIGGVQVMIAGHVE